MTKFFLGYIFVGLCLYGLSSFAQDEVLFKIDNDKITKSDFNRIYKKSNANKEDIYSEASLKEYLDLYIKFKLKVREAKDLGYDTVKTMQDELEKYRKQLAKSYLNDKDVTEKLIKEAYDRMKYDIDVSHILITVSENASPDDTLAAYKKAVEARKKAEKEDFATVARAYSQDPSVKKNNGDLGFFTVFQMVYPFESAAYKTQPGKISNICRTKFGYHILKVNAKRESLGKMRVAHIFVRESQGATDEQKAAAKQRIDDIYAEIQQGGNFDEIAKRQSDDRQSSYKGGELGWFGTGDLVPEFEKAAVAIKEVGGVSPPVHTSYGWHIIKLLEKKPIGTFEEEKDNLARKIKNDSRSNVAQDMLISRIKKDNNFKEYYQAKNDFYNVIDSTLLEGKWNPGKAEGMNATMFELDGKYFTQQDFAKYIDANKRMRRGADKLGEVFNMYYKNFVDESCMNYEESKLETRYPEFRDLMKEYYEGILLFDITDDKVWSYAVKDTVGLTKYFEDNADKYVWGERVDARVYTCADIETADLLREEIEANPMVSVEEIKQKFNGESGKVLIEHNKYVSGENNYVDKTVWQKGLSKNHQTPGGKVILVQILDVIPATKKELNEIRGQVISDYQDKLEKEWVDDLKSKYKVVIYDKVLNSLVDKNKTSQKPVKKSKETVEPSQEVDDKTTDETQKAETTKGDRKGTYWLHFGPK